MQSIRRSSSSRPRRPPMPADSQAARCQREAQRRRFRPISLRVLFIGESPPASGRFFYHGDSGLYRAMRDAFHSVDPCITDANFLAEFQASGCYLIDLCAQPVDHLDRESRRSACLARESSLARTMARLNPERIVTVVRSIEPNATRAAARAGWSGPFLHRTRPANPSCEICRRLEHWMG